MAKIKLQGIDWDFASLLNEAFRSMPDSRQRTPRNYIYASELGYDFASRYLNMHAHTPSNPPNMRSRGKFFMGDMIEWTAYLILTITGVLRKEQLRGEVELPGCLRVSGKLDFVAGGDGIDWEEQKAKVEELQKLFAVAASRMPRFIMYAMSHIIKRMEMMFTRQPLKKYIIECKSVSNIVFELICKLKEPRRHNILQCGHYKLSDKEKVDAATILYWCKDDGRFEQFEIEIGRNFKKMYLEDVKTMTDYYAGSTGSNYLKHIPPLAPEIHFLEGSYKFEKNMNVQYSQYLTMLYGYKDFDSFKDKWSPTLSSWNGAFRRHVLEGKPTGKLGKPLKLTPGNLETIKEIQKAFPEYEKYLITARKAGAFEKQEEEESE
jgi:hypothetical protein